MDSKKIKDYLTKWTEIAGGAVGAAIGLVGGPTGAIIGRALGNAFVSGIKEIINKKLSNRQEIRVAASIAYMVTDIKDKYQLVFCARFNPYKSKCHCILLHNHF